MSPLKNHWRSFGESRSKVLEAMRHREFPTGASELADGFNRREFLKLMAASLALSGVTACTRQPRERIVPYIRQPEDLIPGKPLFFATALTLGGYARGILVQTHEGRPTKIEGNPEHPASLGGSDVFMQAELLGLYDPERSRAVMHHGQIGTWDELLGDLALETPKWNTNRGAGLRLLTRHETSPTFLDQIRRLLLKYPEARWHEHEALPVARQAPRLHLDKAAVIVSLDSDFLSFGPGNLIHSRQFASGRRSEDQMNRLYVIESTPTLTGAMADHRILLHPDRIPAFAQELASGSGSATAIMADLRRNAGKSLVIAGDSQPQEVHDAVRELNRKLGNIGVTVDYSADGEAGLPKAGDLGELMADINSGKVQTLLILGGNPAYDAPADFEFGKALGKISRTVHLGQYPDETAVLCGWHVPETHPLESWSDACAYDGTATIMQPMIEPLFAGVSRHVLLSALLKEPPTNSYEVVRGYWQTQHPGGDFERFWRKSLNDGIVRGGGMKGGSTGASPSQSGAEISRRKDTGKAVAGLHLIIRPSEQVYDGRFANNAWLQEFPNPLTQIVWDNAALISPATSSRLKLENGDVVNLKFRGRSVPAAVLILPGQADECITVNLGYGRTHAGTVGNGIGFNAYALRTSDAIWGGAGLEIEPIPGKTHQLVTTQHHWSMEGRDTVRVGTRAEFQRDRKAITKTDESPPKREETLYPNVPHDGPAWGMAIDLNTCIGCGACTIACQAENNIPVVGKDQVAANREMHWIRVDRYYEGDPANPAVYHQPIPCMHCENAPCELVCPVAATVHSEDGLNQMIYNRCVGTRYCSNNCPYKVRRFNFFEYDANQFERPTTRKLMRNPNVTVRSRGVMEKCTFCIQRISAVRIEARKANRPIRDGEIVPACAQACPADAIVFGDIADANSRVSKFKASPLNYGLLEELNTRPRTTYLAKLRNPNPEFESHEYAG